MEKSAAAMPRLSTRISAIIGLALLAVFTVTLTIMGYFAVAEVEKNVHTSSDRILSVLEATHTQSMLNRGTTEDNDPAILTLDGTFQQLSENQENIKVWLVMGPKVLAFQREYGNEQEPPTDDVDNEAIISGQITARYIENRVYRLSKPVILGQGFAENPKCYTCHSNNMGIQEGEVIGLFSSAYDASDEYTAVWYQLFINALIFAGIIIGTMMIILYLIRKYIGKPLADVSTSIRQLAAGEEIALHKTTGFYELRDIYIAAEVFRNFALNKDQKIDFQKFALDEHAIVSITDVKGNITYVNDKFCAVSGYNREELIGSNHRIVKTDTQSDAFWVSMWKTIANGNTWHGDIRNQNKSGEYYWVKTTIVPSLDGDGKPTQYVGIRTEITDDKLNQTKLMAANSAKSNFLSTMSHEIRTPLNGVLGIAQLMKDTDLNEDQETQVNTILSSGQTLLAILNDVLDMSKIEAGRIELEEKVFCLSDLISTITTPFQTLSDEKGLTLVANNDLKRELAVRGDPVRLRQIIWNLLSNAIKFTEEGQVSLAISDAEATTSENASKIDLKDHLFCFTIKDTGSGIAPDRVGAIFNAFTQEDSSITQKYGGTGLGLSIVKQFAELMGGTIEVESDLGKGTIFSALIPFTAATEEEAEALTLRSEYTLPLKQRPLNILLAEDNQVNAIIAKSFLEKFGHTVEHVENGLLVVEAAKKNWADLILMDIHMPEMNGIDATKAIRATHIGTDLPIIGLTAEAFVERHIEFKKAGMTDILTKPFTEQQLVNILAANGLIDQRDKNRDE